MKIYQASPLFSEAEILWHRALTKKLTVAGYEVCWPGDLLTKEEIIAWGEDAPKQIMHRDRAAIDACDVVVALLDGAQG